MRRETRARVSFLVLSCVLGVRPTVGTEPQLEPLTRTSVAGRWTGIATGEAGQSWMLDIEIGPTGSGVLHIGRADGVNPDLVTATLEFDSVHVAKGVLRVTASAHSTSELWRVVEMEVRGKALSSFGHASGHVTIRGANKIVYFRFPITFIKKARGAYLNEVPGQIQQFLGVSKGSQRE